MDHSHSGKDHGSQSWIIKDNRARIRAVSVPGTMDHSGTTSCTPVAEVLWHFDCASIYLRSALCVIGQRFCGYLGELTYVIRNFDITLINTVSYYSRNSTAVFLLAVNITFFIYDTAYNMFRPSMLAIFTQRT